MLGMLGIDGLTSAHAEGLDIEGADVEAILRAACDDARRLARTLIFENI